jgi:hypothetical protein
MSGNPAIKFEIAARIGRLNEFWGGKTVSEVNAHTRVSSRWLERTV